MYLQIYAHYLANHKDMPLDEVMILDKAQKAKELSIEERAFLEKIEFSLDKKGNKKRRLKVKRKSDQVLVGSVKESVIVTKKNDQVKRKSDQVNDQVNDQVLFDISDLQLKIIAFCDSPKKRKEILENCLGLANHTDSHKKYIEPLLEMDLLSKTWPDKPKSQFQKYIATEKGRKLIG